jgi:radical SAM superfamily enzyme YgiQ (UPF0313 family)
MRVALVGAELEENLGLRYLHAALVRAGHEALILDFHAAGQAPDVVRSILAYAPRVVGLSMVFTARAREFAHLAEELRSAGCTAHVTAGGHFASFHARELLRDFPAFDSVVHGEGEEALVDLVGHTGNLGSVGGLTYRAADGRIRSTWLRPNPDDLDSRPWPTRPEVFHTYLGLPIANILSSRGCFGRCSFCSIRAWYRQNPGKRFRQRAAGQVAREMAALYHERGVRIFNFHDDNFFLPREDANVERFRDLRGRLNGHGVGRIAVQVKARPDSVTPAVMAALVDLGVFRVFLGVENNATAGLRALGRGIRREQNDAALALVRGLGLHATFNLLMFEPEATLSDLRDNIGFMRRWADVPLNFCSTVVYSGTPLEARLRAQGRLCGDYFGYRYRISDERVQTACEIVRRVFAPRQFDDDGMNLQAMKMDYYWHILRHFWPERARPAVGRQVSRAIRLLNRSSADLLDEICDYVSGRDICDAAAVEELAADLASRRAGFDAGASLRAAEIVDQIRRLGLGGRAAGRRRLAGAASVAAAALLAASAGCSTDGTHATEMVPPPTKEPKEHLAPTPTTETPKETPPAKTPSPAETPKGAEMPAPPKTPAQAETPLSTEEAAAVQARVRQAYQAQVTALAAKCGVHGKTIQVVLYLNAQGAVDSLQFRNPAEAGTVQFREQLTGMVFQWAFPAVTKAGSCMVSLETPKGAPKPPRPPPIDGPHIYEMAPRD